MSHLHIILRDKSADDSTYIDVLSMYCDNFDPLNIIAQTNLPESAELKIAFKLLIDSYLKYPEEPLLR